MPDSPNPVMDCLSHQPGIAAVTNRALPPSSVPALAALNSRSCVLA
ncbi:hypothetical protein [Paenarthrobacter sp. PH39-S1]|nr:hypothetical protein [Paenarthrobacter sp. PH39-S1]MDJ0354609.1 hypothetical protein [Paenarthrobacter sp. PH39-S1]